MHRDSGVTPIIGEILMVFLVIILAAIILSIALGIISNPLQENKMAAFSIETGYNGYDRYTHEFDATYLTYLQMAGDDLNVGYDSSVTHGGTDATKITLNSPSGFHVVVDSVTMLEDIVEKGRVYYIFKYYTGSSSDPDDYYLTDNPDRIFGQQGIESLEPGIWEILISDIADSNVVLYRGKVCVR